MNEFSEIHNPLLVVEFKVKLSDLERWLDYMGKQPADQEDDGAYTLLKQIRDSFYDNHEVLIRR